MAAAPKLLYALSRQELATAADDRRWPKWATMCRLRLLGNNVLNGVCVGPDADSATLRECIRMLADTADLAAIMVRSDGGFETAAYYRGGNSFPVDQVEGHAAGLLRDNRAVILMEPANRFTNRLSALLRMDRPAPRQPGNLTVEALGPGYDVGDLTRGGVKPQVTVSITGLTWDRYDPPWWSDLYVVRDLTPTAEAHRRQARLHRVADHILAAVQELPAGAQGSTGIAENWLRTHGYAGLWSGYDPTMRVLRCVPRWFDICFLIGATHGNRAWTCLATGVSDLGDGRVVFWDIVDAAHKFAGMVRRRA